MIDGEAVLLGVDGIADFNALHSGRHDDEVQLYAFDILALDGEDLRGLPLSMRKTNLARLLARRPDGISLRRSSRARSGLISSEPRAGWGLRVLCRNGATGLIRLDGQNTGSR